MKRNRPKSSRPEQFGDPILPQTAENPFMFPGLVFSVIFRNGSRSYLGNVN